MGGGASLDLSQLTARDIAEYVRSLGNAYEGYSQRFTESGIDGMTLKEFKYDEEIEELLESLSITNIIHKKKLTAELKKIVSHTAASFNTAMAHTSPPVRKRDNADDLTSRTKAIKPKPIQAPTAGMLYDSFLSYRVASDKTLVEAIYTGTKAYSVDHDFGRPGQKPHFFMDAFCLRDGEEWEKGFIKGLLCSLVITPFVTWIGPDQGSVGQMLHLSDGKVDNVLLGTLYYFILYHLIIFLLISLFMCIIYINFLQT